MSRMNSQSLGGRRIRPHGPDIPEPCQALEPRTERRCTGPQTHLFSQGGEVVGFCAEHRDTALQHPEYVALEVTA